MQGTQCCRVRGVVRCSLNCRRVCSRCRVRSRCRVTGVRPLSCMRPLVGGYQVGPTLCGRSLIFEISHTKSHLATRWSAIQLPHTCACVQRFPRVYKKGEGERQWKEGCSRPSRPASLPHCLANGGAQCGRASGAAPGLQWLHRCGARPSYFFMGGCDAVRVLGAGGEPVMA